MDRRHRKGHCSQGVARPCAVPELPLAAADYDATDDWIVVALLPALEDCARRHGEIVRAW